MSRPISRIYRGRPLFAHLHTPVAFAHAHPFGRFPESLCNARQSNLFQKIIPPARPPVSLFGGRPASTVVSNWRQDLAALLSFLARLEVSLSLELR